jgi:hypothetical protein
MQRIKCWTLGVTTIIINFELYTYLGNCSRGYIKKKYFIAKRQGENVTLLQ